MQDSCKNAMSGLCDNIRCREFLLSKCKMTGKLVKPENKNSTGVMHDIVFPAMDE